MENKTFVLNNGLYKGWHTANYLCSEQGLELASIDRDKVWELSELIHRRFPKVHTAWVGLRRSEYKMENSTNGKVKLLLPFFKTYSVEFCFHFKTAFSKIQSSMALHYSCMFI